MAGGGENGEKKKKSTQLHYNNPLAWQDGTNGITDDDDCGLPTKVKIEA
jgi:hypothetical protein